MKLPLFLLFSLLLGHYTLAQNDDNCLVFIPMEYAPSISLSNFEIEVTQVKEIRLFIFDRTGNKVFNSSQAINYLPGHQNEEGEDFRIIDSGWDGKQMGRELPEGIYPFVLDATCSDDSKQQWKGVISLLRIEED